MGGRIDSFKEVCRFNAFEIKGYETDVGTKLDTWFNVLEKAGWRAETPWRRVFVHSWQPDRSKCKVSAVFREAEKLDHSLIQEMSEYSGAGYKSWSTGAIAAWRMLKEFDRVTLFGFDWWDKYEHHYCDKAVRGTLHKPEIEKKFFDKLAADGRLTFL